MEMIKAVSPMRQRLADGLFWTGCGLCCLRLVPVCVLLWHIRGIFAAVDWCSLSLKSA